MRVRVPLRFSDAQLCDLDRPQYRMVIEYAGDLIARAKRGEGVERISKGLLLSGESGLGKSYALAALTRCFVGVFSPSMHADHVFVTSPEMFESLGMFEDSRGDHEFDPFRGQSWRETLVKVPWLVINDLGKEYRGGKMSEQAEFKLGRVLRARSERCRITHVTTNLSPGSLGRIYGESTASLLAEMTDAYTIEGEDRRHAELANRGGVR